jgi:Tol biopolymer transport system component
MGCCERKTRNAKQGAPGVLWLALLCLSPCLGAAEPVRLTNDGKLKFSPVFFNGGREIIYADLEKPEQYRLQRLNLATGAVEPLHPKATTSEFEPAVSADGKTYAFLRATGILRVSVIIRDIASGAEVEVPPGAGFSGLRGPALAPDGSRLAFSFADKGQHIYTVDRRGAGRKTLTIGEGINTDPCYSPDGKRIAFSSTRDGNYEIYVMDADGGNVRRLTRNPYRDVRPRFSPDGKRIAFTSHRDGNAEIYVMNADGTEQRRVTNHPERDDYAAWHPDGKRLVIVSERDGKHDLYMIEVGGAGPK